MSCESFILAYDDENLEKFKKVFHKYEMNHWDYLPLVLDNIQDFWKMNNDDEKIIDSDYLCTVHYALKEPFKLMFYEHKWKKKEDLHFQKRFEDYCRKLRIDISNVQPLFDELVSMTDNPKYMKYPYYEKDNYPTNEYMNKVDKFADELKKNIEWKYMVGLNYLDYDNFDIEEYEPCIRCVLDAMSTEEQGDNGFVVVSAYYMKDKEYIENV